MRTRAELRRRWILSSVLAAAGLAIGVADVWLNRAIEPLRHTGGDEVQRLFPQTARLDLLLLVMLAALVAAVIGNDAVERMGVRDSGGMRLTLVVGVSLGVAGVVLLSPTLGVLVLLAFLVVAWIGPHLTDGPAAEVRSLVTLALALRVLVAFGLGLYGLATHGGAPVLDDEESLHRAAAEVAPMLTSGFGYVQPAWWHLPNPYLALLAGTYAIIGPDFSAVRVLNASLGALGVALVYGIVQRVFDQRAARAVALVLAVWPAAVLWTGTGLRESLFTTCSLLVPWLLTRRLALPGWSVAASAGLLALLVIGALRNYAAAALAIGVVAAALKTRPVLAPVLLVLGALIWVRLPLAEELTPRGVEYRAAAIELSTVPETDPAKRPPPPDPANQFWITTIVRARLPGETGLTTAVVYGYQTDPFRYVVATGQNSLYTLSPEDVEPLSENTVTWAVPMARLLDGVRLLFAPPTPWDSMSLQRLAAMSDALAWDVLFIVGLLSVFRPRGSWSAASVATLVYLALMILALALASSNLGTAVRHRGMLVPWVAMLSAPLLARLLGQLELPRLWRLRSPSLTREVG